jgi:hypothetical protein
MRALLLAGTSLLALSVTVPGAEATPIATFSYTGQMQTWTVPITGNYEIEAIGAAGGTEPFPILGDASGGQGAVVTSDFSLTAGEKLDIVVGGKGADGPSVGFGAGGGGGGSFVVGPGNTPLVIAGGGGGGGSTHLANGNSASSSATKGNNTPGGGAGGLAGIAGGGGGGGGGCAGNSATCNLVDAFGNNVFGDGGGGGGGLNGDGQAGVTVSGPSYPGAGGSSFVKGAGGGAGSGNGGNGGFGGGGGGGYLGGGGGGGYNGGGGGGGDKPLLIGIAGEGYGGGAGGSVAAYGGTNSTFGTETCGVGNIFGCIGNGAVAFTELGGLGSSLPSPPPSPVPEPASLALFGTGLAGLGLIRRRRR